jgi:hypothetical protein
MSMASGDSQRITSNDSTTPMQNSNECEGCDGSGVRVPATPSCRLPPISEDFHVVERCDYCQRFSSDLNAALSIFKEAQVIRCACDGDHVIARGSL